MDRTTPDSDRSLPKATAGLDELVVLDPDHPGFRDAEYRKRRNEIARLSLTALPGEPPPRCEYTEEEHAVWRTVWTHLEPVLRERACRAFFEGVEVAALDRTRIPQLADVNERLAPVSGFRMTPVAGLVTSRSFHAFLARSEFLSTQYIRHASVPLYTPEPDVVHELIGHANVLGHPMFAELNRLAGLAAARLNDAQMTALERVYWFTLEFGAVREDGEIKAYGAGLLSSFGELGRFREEATLKPMDLEEIARTPYDPTRYQDTIFVAPDMATMESSLREWFGKLIAG